MGKNHEFQMHVPSCKRNRSIGIRFSRYRFYDMEAKEADIIVVKWHLSIRSPHSILRSESLTSEL